MKVATHGERVRSSMPAPQAPHAPAKLVEVLEKLQQCKRLDIRLEERDETPLIWAVSENYHDIAVTLIEAGVDLNARNVDGNTALLRAARPASCAMVASRSYTMGGPTTDSPA